MKVWVLLAGVSPKIDVPSTFMHDNSRSSEGAHQSQQSPLLSITFYFVSQLLSIQGLLLVGPIIGQKVGAQFLKIDCMSASISNHNSLFKRKATITACLDFHHIEIDSQARESFT